MLLLVVHAVVCLFVSVTVTVTVAVAALVVVTAALAVDGVVVAAVAVSVAHRQRQQQQPKWGRRPMAKQPAGNFSFIMVHTWRTIINSNIS